MNFICRFAVEGVAVPSPRPSAPAAAASPAVPGPVPAAHAHAADPGARRLARLPRRGKPKNKL